MILRISFLFAVTIVGLSSMSQTKLEWTGYFIEDDDTIPVTFSLVRTDSALSGTARYTYGKKHWVIYNVSGKLRGNDSVFLSDSFIHDKFMPMGCNFYGDYALKTSFDNSVLSGIWESPGGPPGRKNAQANIFLVKKTPDMTNVDSLMFISTIQQRKDSVVKVVQSRHQRVRIEIFDNAQIDDDRISVFLNGQLIVKNQRITGTPTQVVLDIDPVMPGSTLKFVAENEGNIPPNTARIRIFTGEGEESLLVSSSFVHNAVIQFRLIK